MKCVTGALKGRV